MKDNENVNCLFVVAITLICRRNWGFSSKIFFVLVFIALLFTKLRRRKKRFLLVAI